MELYGGKYYNPNLYTDLATERRRAMPSAEGVEYRVNESPGGTWESVKILTEKAAREIGRPIGRYDTLNTGRLDTLTDEELDDAQEEIAKKLCLMLDELGVSPERLLVVGLGNPRLTPDSVGPKTTMRVRATKHISDADRQAFLALECSEISVISPGVAIDSGMEAFDIIKSICTGLNPDAVIAVDSIISHSEERLGTTFQLSNTGICPGSGIGNAKRSISESTLGIPVFAIGVPTVIDSRVFQRHPTGGESSMLVSPREIDEITDSAARVIGGAVNQAFGIYF